MRRVIASNYYELRAKYPKAFMIRSVPGGYYEGYVDDVEDPSPTDYQPQEPHSDERIDDE